MYTSKWQFRRTVATSTIPQGVSLAEYGMLLGLVVLLGLAGMQMLGQSTAKLLPGADHALVRNSTLSLLTNTSPVQLASKTNPTPATAESSLSLGVGERIPLKGTGYYNIIQDPITGHPVLSVVDGANGVETNVSSIDGSKMNTLGSMMIASSLQELADKQTDPELKAYYAEMAKYSYYLGSAEGELDDIPGLNLDPAKYSNGDALRDIYQYNKKLNKLMNNPPAGLEPQAFAEVMPLAATVYNIANRYLNALDKFIAPDGTVKKDFGSASTLRSGDKTPGSVFTVTDMDDKFGAGVMTNCNYENLVSYGDMKQLANKLLATEKVLTEPVASTLESAVAIEQAAQTTMEQP